MRSVIIIAIIVVVIIAGILTSSIPEERTVSDGFEVNATETTSEGLFLVMKSSEDFLGLSESDSELYDKFLMSPKKENKLLYDSLNPKNSTQSTVVIIPTFTLLAYSDHGFYSYYSGNCDESCLTVDSRNISENLRYGFATSAHASQVFQLLGYDTITDVDLELNPKVISKYDKVILLHNEYVTKDMFLAITSHPKVIYLYPNALYAEISIDEKLNAITLVRGHGYPEQGITNGFDWAHDNTHPYEFDIECIGWEFYPIDNGFMLNCYPENIIYKDIEFLKMIRDL